MRGDGRAGNLHLPLSVSIHAPRMRGVDVDPETWDDLIEFQSTPLA